MRKKTWLGALLVVSGFGFFAVCFHRFDPQTSLDLEGMMAWVVLIAFAVAAFVDYRAQRK